jgi:hypothetical protein
MTDEQPSPFRNLWRKPELDRSLTQLDEDHVAHMRNASKFYGWAVTMAAMGHDPGTPKQPMRLPSEHWTKETNE